MLNTQFLERLEIETQRLVDDFDIPGAAMGVIFGDESWTSCFGFTKREDSLPVTENTLFQVGSITKTLTATVVMCLVERGQLDLDVPVACYVDELVLEPSVLNILTIRHLLLHTGGWKPDNNFSNNDTGDGDDALATYIQIMTDLPRLALPGELWSYSNAGFRLLGRVIESITGMSYEKVVNQMVIEPLGLNNSLFSPDNIHLRPYAFGHLKTDKELRRLKREIFASKCSTCWRALYKPSRSYDVRALSSWRFR